MEQFGQYTLLKRIAIGGMGELFLAQKAGIAGFSKQLIVKRIRPGFVHDQDFRDMFLNEGRVAAMIDHPNVVHIYELGEVEGNYFIAMEYVSGKNLQTLLETIRGPLALPLALHVLGQLCEGVAFAHDATDSQGRPLDLVHRDISPPNVLISYSGAIKLTDFGIAKVARSVAQQTAAGVLKGKFAYLSPEQARGEKLDRRSDVFSLGLVLFEATTGERAVPGEADTEVLYSVAQGQLRRPGDYVEGYPPALAAIYARATARRREDRYLDAKALQEDLLQFQMDQRLFTTASKMAAFMQSTFREDARAEGESMFDSVPPTVGASLPVQSSPAAAVTLVPRTPAGSSPDDRCRPGESEPRAVAARGRSDVAARRPPTGTGPRIPRLPSTGPQQISPSGQRHPQPAGRDPALFSTKPYVKTRLEAAIEPTAIADWDPAALPEAPAPRTVEADISASPGAPSPPPADSPALSFGDEGFFTPIHAGAADATDIENPAGSVTGAVGELDALRDGSPNRGWMLWVATVLLVLVAGFVVFLLYAPSSAPPWVHSMREGLGFAEELPVVAPLDAGVAPEIGVRVDPLDAQASPEAAQPDASPGRAGREVVDAPGFVGKGRLRVVSKPALTVSVRGRRLGKTPVAVSLERGAHVVRLHDRRAGINITRRVLIRRSQTTTLRVSVGKGVLVVRARPWAHVEINGRRRGTTPMRPLSLTEGTYELSLKNDELKQVFRRRIRILPNKTTTIMHRFQ